MLELEKGGGNSGQVYHRPQEGMGRERTVACEETLKLADPALNKAKAQDVAETRLKILKSRGDKL
jgi:hypothetical protein